MKRRAVGAAIVLGLAAVPATWTLWQQHRVDRSLMHRIDALASAPDAVVPCRPDAEKPLVLLALGQSNAANLGAARGATPAMAVFAEGRCHPAADPLPNASGQGGSLWTRLPEALRRSGASQRVLLVPLAVDASAIDDWTRGNSPLRHRLRVLMHSMREAQIQPDFVLWQQGEADAQRGTSSAAYFSNVGRLRALLDEEGVRAPLVMALSTHCRGTDGRAVRDAMVRVAHGRADILIGPDTDTLQGDRYRADGCHFSAPGLEAAAAAWASVLTRQLRLRAP